jgi:DNA-binding MarR family transcriptional regulator
MAKKKAKKKQQQDNAGYLDEWKDSFTDLLKGMNKAGADNSTGAISAQEKTAHGENTAHGDKKAPGAKSALKEKKDGAKIDPGAEKSGAEMVPGAEKSGAKNAQEEKTAHGDKKGPGEKTAPKGTTHGTKPYTHRFNQKIIDVLLKQKLNKGAIWLFVYLLANLDNNTEYISIREIAKEYGMRRKTLYPALDELFEAGLIVKHKMPNNLFKVKLLPELVGAENAHTDRLNDDIYYLNNQSNNHGGAKKAPGKINRVEEKRLEKIIAVLTLLKILKNKSGNFNISVKFSKEIVKHAEQQELTKLTICAITTKEKAKRNPGAYLLSVLENFDHAVIEESEKARAEKMLADTEFILRGNIKDESTETLRNVLHRIDASIDPRFTNREEAKTHLQNIRKTLEDTIDKAKPKLLELSNKSPSKRA